MLLAAFQFLLLWLSSPGSGDTTITASDFQRAIEAYIAQSCSSGTIPMENMMIEYRGIPEAITLREKDIHLRVVPSGLPILKGNVILPMEIVTGTRTLKRLIISLKIRTFEDVFFAKRKIERHQEITNEDVTIRRVETTYLPRNIITSEQQFAGVRTSRVIFPERPLTGDMFELPPAIEQGNDVIIVVVVNNVILRTKGKAKQSGRIGDIISVVPLCGTASGEHLKVKILDTQTVEVVEQ